MRTKNVTILSVIVLFLATNIGFADLSDGLVAYYPFEGNANEVSGNPASSDGIENSYPYYVTGAVGQAIKFDGVDDWVSATCEDIIVAGTQDSFALSFWFKPTSTWVEGGSGYPNGELFGNIDHWIAGDWLVTIGGLTSHGRLQFNVYDEPYPDVPVVLNTVRDNWIADTWYNVTYSHDASTRIFSVYINGVFDNATTLYEDIGRNWAGEHFSIARYNADYIDMSFDELRLYNRTLSESEIYDLYVVPVPSAVLLGFIGMGFAGWKLRKQTKE